ncbi:CRISPR-associated endoribonuclease Cas6 [Geosporobacter ferrireducens]|uniref:CRISPR-associated endoribonuclease Cas6 n=1 Tax=Geosporobacter ferrireducens TaxID=1424294 RepID=A0A1D8GIV6_9FIRM|nr:CRISPR-associated endoribonuclease Cas6 [Geosporobacter ferrireducens]AOT70855.1 CRISPR-associated endoribonuclease Cas6 [Geosporobacter ferrireducens]
MRLKCEYKASKIPITYQMMFVSLIKEALKISDSDYFQKLYKYGDAANKQSKNFTFAVYMKDYEIADEIFSIKDKVVLNISSPDLEFMIKVYNGLLKLNQFKYKDYLLNKIRIDLVKEKEITSSEVMLKTLSPICIKTKNHRFMKPEDETYVDELNYIADIVLRNYRGQGLQEKLDFIPLQMKKTVVKEEIRDYKANTGDKHLQIHAYAGTFKLKGNVDDLKDLYALGISFKRNQGFGMVEVI